MTGSKTQKRLYTFYAAETVGLVILILLYIYLGVLQDLPVDQALKYKNEALFKIDIEAETKLAIDGVSPYFKLLLTYLIYIYSIHCHGLWHLYLPLN